MYFNNLTTKRNVKICSVKILKTFQMRTNTFNFYKK